MDPYLGLQSKRTFTILESVIVYLPNPSTSSKMRSKVNFLSWPVNHAKFKEPRLSYYLP